MRHGKFSKDLREYVEKKPRAKHTLGPWVAAMLRSSSKWHEVRTANGKTIASVSAAREEMDANAYLIAAAPELLEALEEAVRWADESENDPCEICGVARAKCGCWLGLARAAIAKARGETK